MPLFTNNIFSLWYQSTSPFLPFSETSHPFPTLHTMADNPQHNQIAIANPQNPGNPLQLINISNQNIVKLTSTNYLSWKLQIKEILIGYDIYKFTDGCHLCPPVLSPQITPKHLILIFSLGFVKINFCLVPLLAPSCLR